MNALRSVEKPWRYLVRASLADKLDPLLGSVSENAEPEDVVQPDRFPITIRNSK
jgi:hypothetical protein